METARELISIFRYLRPALFAARNRCLLNSLVLLEFLECYGIRCEWIFGVKMAPFSAHCWLQRDGYVLNGVPEHVGSYAVIVVV